MLLLHGCPFASFIWRRLIPALAPTHPCLAPAGELGLCIGLASLVFFAVEAEKWMRRRQSHRRSLMQIKSFIVAMDLDDPAIAAAKWSPELFVTSACSCYH